MTELSLELMAAVSVKALEEAAFMFCELVEDAPPFDGELLQAEIEFEGDWAGRMLVTASRELLAAAVDNLLDAGAHASETAARDAVGEFANIIAGLLAVEIFGPKALCRFGTPIVRILSPEEAERLADPSALVAHLLSEDGVRLDIAVLRNASAARAGARVASGGAA